MLSLKQPLDDGTVEYLGHRYPAIDIEGNKYPLDLSYDNVLRWYDLIKDDDFSEYDKIVTAFKMFILDLDANGNIPFNIQAETVETIAKYVAGDSKTASGSEPQKEYFNFEEDADLIYASFLQEYGIDLIDQQGKLRWEKFIALLNGLRDETKFKQIVAIRAEELPTGNDEYDQAERKRLLKLKSIYALKSNRPTVQQQETAADDMFDSLYKQALKKKGGKQNG